MNSVIFIPSRLTHHRYLLYILMLMMLTARQFTTAICPTAVLVCYELAYGRNQNDSVRSYNSKLITSSAAVYFPNYGLRIATCNVQYPYFLTFIKLANINLQYLKYRKTSFIDSCSMSFYFFITKHLNIMYFTKCNDIGT